AADLGVAGGRSARVDDERALVVGSEAVTVDVLEVANEHPLVDRTVAVVVDAVARFRRAGPDARVRVVAVVAAELAVAAERVERAVLVGVAITEGRGVAVLVDVRGIA